LVDRNTETLSDADFGWADLAWRLAGCCRSKPMRFTSIDLRMRARPVAVGGLDITSSPEAYERRDFGSRRGGSDHWRASDA
jgi:hypothetical protein